MITIPNNPIKLKIVGSRAMIGCPSIDPHRFEWIIARNIMSYSYSDGAAGYWVDVELPGGSARIKCTEDELDAAMSEIERRYGPESLR